MNAHACHDPPAISVRPAALTSPEASALIAALNVELEGRYPEPGATHFRLDEAEVQAGRGAFLVAYRDGEPVGCGALRKLDATTAELKRMYVAPAARRLGVSKRILDALEAEARTLGVARLVLETGVRQPEALGLYAGAGFTPAAKFGDYVDSPLSVCLEKHLVPLP